MNEREKKRFEKEQQRSNTNADPKLARLGAFARALDAHGFCRTLLKQTLEAHKKDDPFRFLKAEVEGKMKLGHHTTYFMKVTDHRDPCTGTRFPSEGQPGHFRTATYEVDACCTYCAKVEALNKHESKFKNTTKESP